MKFTDGRSGRSNRLLLALTTFFGAIGIMTVAPGWVNAASAASTCVPAPAGAPIYTDPDRGRYGSGWVDGVTSTPTFDVAFQEGHINDLDTPASFTVSYSKTDTRQFGMTFNLSINPNLNKGSYKNFLTGMVSASIQTSHTTALNVSTTVTVPPHGRVLVQRGVEAFDVSMRIHTCICIGIVNCVGGIVQVTSHAPTNIERWRSLNG